MPNTLSQIRSLCRRRLSDLTAPYTFSDLQVNQWINDALAEISKALPRLLEIEIEADGETPVFELPEGCRAIVAVQTDVEQPGSSDPPGSSNPLHYLSPLDLRQAGFDQAAVYDFLPAGSASQPSQLILGSTPADGETVRLRCLADHEWLDDDADECSLPDEQLELVVLFVRWASLQALASQEAANPDPASGGRLALEGNLPAAESAFRRSLESAVRLSALSRRSAWREAAQERIY